MNRIFYYNKLGSRQNRKLDRDNKNDLLMINMIIYNVINRLDQPNGNHEIKLSFNNTDVICKLIITPLEVLIIEKEIINKEEEI